MDDARDIELLMAYADGELDAAEARAVERRLEADAEARRLVAMLIQQPGLVRAAFAETPIPESVRPAANANRPAGGGFYRTAAAIVLLLTGVAAGWVGAELRIRADTDDRVAIMQAALDAQRAALNVALERNSNGEPGQWVSAKGDARGTITPLMTFVNEEGSFCREVEQDFTINGRSQTAMGLACRVGEGEWRVRYWLFENPNSLPELPL